MASTRARGVAIAALVAVVAFVAAFGLTRLARDESTPLSAPPSRSPLPQAVGAATAAPAPGPTTTPGRAPTARGVRHALAPVLAEPGFGGRLLARIVDAETGAVLYDHGGSVPAAPASTAKLLTAAAVLAVHAPSTRFTTRVLDAGAGTLVIVGGGDPTLSAAPQGSAPLYPGAGRMSELAAQVRKSGVPVRRIVVDGSLFAGPSVSPYWDPSDMGTGYGAPITAFLADGARPSPRSNARSGVQPDIDAAKEFAALLGAKNLPISQGKAPAGAKQIGSVASAPLSELITQMLQESDNVIADVLARQVALAEHVPASFSGATAGIRTVLAGLGVQVGAGMKDGSGLSSADRVSPAALVGVLRLIAGATGPPAAAQLHFIASALPVGGWSGTLSYRFTTGTLAAAAGRVRAKTGTLTSVSSLAGFVRDTSGRLLIFSLDADRAAGTLVADAALDDVVGTLAACGC
ncbi:MAG TPA: D-alanyl-D-alanine carboxypeptidase/D-alanyl-D-alanine-endopeptidase [Jatrophihabitantaceae bacterium]